MDLVKGTAIGAEPDVRHRIRQLRWFKTSFRHDARLIGERYGLSVAIDDRKLTEAFLNWAEIFAIQKEYAQLDRRDFAIFAAALLLREMLRVHPVEVASAFTRAKDTAALPDSSGPIARDWPEGFIYTNYCLCVVGAVLEQEGMSLTLPALADDMRTWWSYRENVADDPSQAIAFFDLFTGNEPNWWMPDSVLSRAAMKKAVAARVMPLAQAARQLA